MEESNPLQEGGAGGKLGKLYVRGSCRELQGPLLRMWKELLKLKRPPAGGEDRASPTTAELGMAWPSSSAFASLQG